MAGLSTEYVNAVLTSLMHSRSSLWQEFLHFYSVSILRMYRGLFTLCLVVLAGDSFTSR